MALIATFVLISCISLVFGQECVCGTGSGSTRIIGGSEVGEAKYPWMAFLLIKKHSGKYSQCGGAIINDRYILTAAHCVREAKSVKVGVGSIYDHTGNKKLLRSESFLKHPEYEQQQRKNDIALIKLAQPLQWSKEIQPICLPSKDMDRSGTLTVAGWGVKNIETEEASNVLLETQVEEYDFDKCKRKIPYINEAYHFCAALIGKDSCSGDSGGPLWKNKSGRSYAVGLVSFGPKKCGTTQSSVYTKVSNYIDWIRKNTDDANYCSN